MGSFVKFEYLMVLRKKYKLFAIKMLCIFGTAVGNYTQNTVFHSDENVFLSVCFQRLFGVGRPESLNCVIKMVL